MEVYYLHFQKGIQEVKVSPRTPLSKSHISGRPPVNDLGVLIFFLILTPPYYLPKENLNSLLVYPGDLYLY
tara:strand:+ start:384 stop:596 length:213 start_codon:yes stop_codon:yes gene_type:complete